MAVPPLSILISHAVTNCSRISCLSPQLKFQNYYSQCLANLHNLTTSQPHYWSHVRTFSPSSFHIWQTYPSPFSIEIQTCTHFASSEKAWPTKIWTLELPAYFKFKHHWQNFRASRPSSSFSSHCHTSQFLPYRKFHSTETALLKLTNDIMDTIDSGKITILTALDMSAAFDTRPRHTSPQT